MTNKERLEITQKIDNRILELTGVPFQIDIGQGSKERKISDTQWKTIAREFSLHPQTVKQWLQVSHQPAPLLRHVEAGGPWVYYLTASFAPKPIRDILFQKIHNGEFSSSEQVKLFIQNWKINKQDASLPLEISGKNDEEKKSWGQYVRDTFLSSRRFDLRVESQKRFGDTSPHHMGNMQALFSLQKSVLEKELGKSIVNKKGVYMIEDETIEPSDIADIAMVSGIPQNKESKPKTKTAVLVVREVRDSRGSKYEIDVVGEFNRNMMKEALKQLMEAFI